MLKESKKHLDRLEQDLNIDDMKMQLAHIGQERTKEKNV